MLVNANADTFHAKKRKPEMRTVLIMVSEACLKSVAVLRHPIHHALSSSFELVLTSVNCDLFKPDLPMRASAKITYCTVHTVEVYNTSFFSRRNKARPPTMLSTTIAVASLLLTPTASFVSRPAPFVRNGSSLRMSLDPSETALVFIEYQVKLDALGLIYLELVQCNFALNSRRFSVSIL
jgi:hypothetical protein